MLIHVIVPGKIIHHSGTLAMRFNLNPHLTLRKIKSTVVKMPMPYFWVFKILLFKLNIFVLSYDVINYQHTLFSFVIDESYIRNGKYLVSLFWLYIVCFDFNIWTWERIAQASKQCARQDKKKVSRQKSEMNTKAATAKHQPCSMQKPTSARRENQRPLHLLLEEKCG